METVNSSCHVPMFWRAQLCLTSSDIHQQVARPLQGRICAEKEGSFRRSVVFAVEASAVRQCSVNCHTAQICFNAFQPQQTTSTHIKTDAQPKLRPARPQATQAITILHNSAGPCTGPYHCTLAFHGELICSVSKQQETTLPSLLPCSRCPVETYQSLAAQ